MNDAYHRAMDRVYRPLPPELNPSWAALLTRLDMALDRAHSGDEVLLYLGREHYSRLQSYVGGITCNPTLGLVHCQLRELPTPVVVTVQSMVEGQRA